MCIALFLTASHLPLAFAQGEEPPSLEAELLEGLDDELLDDGLLDQLAPPADVPADGAVDQEEPEDDGARGFGAVDPEDPLARIGSRMRDVEARLKERELAGDTREMQEAIVADLDELLALLRKQQSQQQQSGSQSPPPSQRSDPSQRPRQEQPQPQPEDVTSKSAAEESTPGIRDAAQARAEAAEMEALMKSVWGHLPEQAREQMRQSSTDKFLPKYELLIEKIYRRMAEER